MLRDLLRRKKPARARRVALHAEWLEPRLLYSADAASLLVTTTDPEADAPETRTLTTSYEYGAQAAATPTAAEVRAAYALTPLQFEANQGQLPEGVDFAAFGSGYGIRLSGGEAEILLAGAENPVRLQLVGARDGEVVGENLLATRSNFLVGQDSSQWVTDIANYGSVLYEDVYEGIDVRYYGNQGQLEYDFLVAPGADASQLKLRFGGVEHMEITAEGDLVLRVTGSDRELRFAAPFSYQDGPNGRETVASRYELQADGTVRIVVGEYDTTRALVVDPVLRYSTYFGESGTDVPTAVAIGADGSVYVTGYTNSLTGTLDPRLGANAGGVDMFVAKFSADLSTLIYATRIGGNLDDRGHAIAVDASGNAVVVGTVGSSNFPTAAAAGTTVDQAALDGTKDAVVLKLNASGNGLVFSTFFGGSGNNDAGASVALDASGNIYVAGTIAVGTNEDAFLNVYNANGVRQSARQFGGSGSDLGSGVAVDGAGNAYLVGTLTSSVTMVNGHQTTRGGGPDGFLVRYNASGTITYSTYIGHSNGDSAVKVAVDENGRAYVIGRTDQPDNTGFAVTSGALITTPPTHNTGYLRIYDTSVSGAGSLAYSTFIGGSGNNDIPTGIAIIGGSRAVVVGTTDSSDLPTTADAIRRTNSTTSAFAMVVDPGLAGSAQLAYGTYYATDPTMGGVAVNGNTFYLAGGTTQAGIVSGGYKTTIGSNGDGFIAAIGGFTYNTAPVLNGANNLPPVAEDSTGGSGALVSSLLNVTDSDAGAEGGIAITAADSGNGTWQYSQDGTNWTTFSTPATGNALLLAADSNTRVRFIPAANYNGQSSITFRAWDRTSGTAGTVRAVGITGGNSAFSTGTATSYVTVTALNDLPVAAPASATGGEDAASIPITLTGSDLEDGGIAGVKLLAAPANGLLYTDASLQTLATTNTVYAGGSVTFWFVPAANFNGSTSFGYTVVDSAGDSAAAPLTAAITVTPANDAPVLPGTTDLPSQAEDAAAGSGVLVSTLVASSTDVDAGAVSGIAVTAVGSGGSWQYSLDGSTWTTIAAPAAGEALLLAADGSTRVRFVSSPDFTGSSSISFRVWDRSSGTAGTVVTVGATGGTSAFSTAIATASVTVTAVNDAPVLAGANDLPAQLEESAAGSGTLVTALVAGQVTEVDAAALGGIAITGTSGSGTWQYSLNGTTWTTFTGPADGSALLLAADGSTRVRFVPAPNFAGNAGLTFRAWDRTSGTAGTVVTLPATGGSSAFSSTTATAYAPVTGINDAPVVVGTPTASLTFTESATPISLAGAGFNFAPGGGSDEAAQTITIVITRLPTNAGTLQLADGTPVVLGGTYTLNQLQNMQLVGTGPGDALMFTVRDSGGTANGGQDTLVDQFLSISISNVAPVLNGSNGFTQQEDVAGNGTLVSDLLTGQVGDPGGAYGIAVTAVPSAGAANGTWQYSLDGGASWLTLGGSNANSRLLGPDARVRFVSDAGENINGNIPGFTFRAWDGSSGTSGGQASTNSNGGTTAFSSATTTASLYVVPVNDIPVRYDIDARVLLPAPANVVVNEASGTTSLGFANLEYIPGYSQEEYDNQALTYTVTGVPAAAVGTVFLSDGVTVVTANTSYTIAEIRGMSFRPAAGVQNATATFSWKVQDNAGTANGGVDTLLESITITVRNVAPTLTGANALPNITEDTPGNGMRVSDLIDGKASDPSNRLGIAVTSAPVTAGGTWQYSSDGGTTWNSLSGAGTTNAILLEAGGQWRVRFNPGANWNGTPAGFTFRAWDRSTGTGGGTADTSVNGGTSAFSAGSVTSTLTVGAVNDAPTRTDSTAPLGPLILLDGSPMTSLGLAGVSFGPGGGADEATQTIQSYTITSLPSSLGTTYLADGTTPVVVGNSYTLAQIQGMQFLSSGVGALGTAAFSFSVRDSGNTLNGGTNTGNFTVNVVVNRAPVLYGANSPLTVFEDFDWTGNAPTGQVPVWASPAQRTGVLVSDLIAGQVFDTTGSEGGIAITALSGNGTWQYTTNGGDTWITITGVSNSGALQLAADSQTRIRFLPAADYNSTMGTTGVTFRAWDRTVGTPGTLGDATWNGGPFAYSAATATSIVTVTARNDAPIAVGTVGGSVEEGAAPVTMLAAGTYAPGPATATDEAGQTLTFRFTSISTQVQVLLADGVTVATVGTAYTLEQFQGMQFRSATNAIPGTAEVKFEVQDTGGVANGGIDKANHTLSLTVRNRAPELNGANPLATIQEDTPGNGTLVADLVAGQVVDPTGRRGIAVTGLDSTNGTWQYTRDGGTTWTAFGTPSTGSARLLVADTLTRVRFVPNADWSGTASLTFAAWDGTSGTAGAVGNAGIAGGSTAFSTATATSTITVTPVNDPPMGGVVGSLTVNEDSGSTGLGLGAISYGPGGGSQEAGQVLTFSATAVPPPTFGTITLADGTLVVPGDYSIEQLRGMRFVTAANATGTSSFSFQVKDNGGGNDTLLQTVPITITPVNDAPVANPDVLAGTEDQPLTITPAMLLGNDTDAENDALVITGVVNGTGGTVALVDGNVVFTPQANFTGAATFSYTVSDGQGGSATGSVTVNVAPSNDAPVAGNDAVTGTASNPLVIAPATLLANDADADGDTLTVTAVGNAVNGTVRIENGNIVFEPTPLYLGAASFSYTVSDGKGGTTTGTVAVTLIAGNAPVATADSRTTAEDTPLVLDASDLLANDYDLDGDVLTVTGVSAVEGGSVSLVGGTITFSPTANHNGPARFTYTVADGRGGTATATVTVDVTPENDLPVPVADAVDGTEDQPLVLSPAALLANDTDADGDVLTFTGVSNGSGGTVALVDGNIVFTPTANFSGAATFSYTVTDASGTDRVGTVTVNVAEVNDAPAADADGAAATEDQVLTLAPLVLLGNDTDADGNVLTIQDVSSGTGGTVALVDGNVVFTPTANFHGTASFSYTVSDGRGGTSTAVVTVTVAPVNDNPVASGESFTIDEDAPLTISPETLLANDSDVDGHALSIAGVTSGSGGTVDIVDGKVVFTPAANFTGVATFSYTVSDGQGGSAVATVTVNVTPLNDAPTVVADVLAGVEDTPLVIAPATLLANDSDVDGDTLEIIGLADGTGGTVAYSGENIVFTPNANFNGAGSFSYTVSDGKGGVVTRTVTVNVAAVNDAPLAHADLLAAAEDTPLTISTGSLLANDEDVENHTLTVTGVSNVIGGTAVLSGGEILFTPTTNFSGTASFIYTISDGNGGTSSATVTLVVAPVNDAPVANTETLAGTEDTPLVIAPATLLANDTDLEGGTLSIVGVADGAGGQVNIVDGNIVFTPDTNFSGPASFYYTVSDGNGGIATVLVSVNVAAVNDAPLLVDDAFTGTEDTPLSLAAGDLLANDSDVEGNPLTLTGVTAISGGAVSLDAGVITFTPDANFNGPAVFHYTVSDGQGGTSTGTVTIGLAPVEEAPDAVDDTVAATEDQVLTILPNTLLGNDSEVDGDPLTIIDVTGGTGGTVALVDGNVVFTPALNFNGVATFSYTISDGKGGTATASVTVNVAAVNDVPVVTGEAVAGIEDQAVSIPLADLLANDSDPDGDPLVITGAGGASGGSVEIVGGNVVFTPTVNHNGAASFSYTVSDGKGGLVSGTVSITLGAVDDATQATADVVPTNEDTAVAGNVLGNDTDVDSQLSVASFQVAGDPAVYTAGTTVTIAGRGTLVLAADGSFSFSPVANWNGSVPVVSYTTNTGASSTLAITVAAVDDASVLVADTAAGAEDTTRTGNVLANDGDIDSTLQVASFTLDGASYAAGTTVAVASVGSFTLDAGGAYTFTPVANWNGALPQVTYTTNTGSSSTLDITVDPVNDPTVMVPETVSIDEDGVASGNVLSNDSEVETPLQVTSFTIGGISHAAGSTVTVGSAGSFSLAANGSFTFTPAPNWNGTVPQVTYTTNTGASSTLAITVNAVDDATVVVADTATVNEDNAATGNVLANDSDVETTLQVTNFSISGSTYAAGSNVAIAGVGSFSLGTNGAYSFTPVANWNGTVPVVSYSTNTGGSSTLAITVDPVDDATVVVADTATVNEDNAATGNVLANDSDVDTTLQVTNFSVAGSTYAAGSNAVLAGIGSFSLGANGAYSFTPVANWNGTVPQVTYTTNTGASSTLAITVNAVDDATVVGADAVTVNEDNAATGNVLANDSDVETALQVTSFTIGGISHAAGSTVTVGSAGSFSLAANGSFTFTPAPNWNGTVPQVTYTTNTGASSTLAITVNGVDDAAVVVADTATVNEDNPATGNVLANDSDVETPLQVTNFTVAGSTYAAGSSVAIAGVGSFSLGANGAYIFTPVANWNGTVPVVSYSTNTGASSTLAITVDPVDDATVVVADTATVNEDNAATGNVLANDSDVETPLQVTSFTIAGTSHAAGSTAAIAGVGSFTLAANGTYSFSPVANWNGSVPVIAYTTNTGAGSTLAITVDAVDDATVVGADAVTVDEDNAATGNVLANDSDVETPLQVTSFSIAGSSYAAGSTVAIAGAGSFTLGADGAFTFIPVANWNGTVPQVTYTTNTGAGSTLAITVAPVDDASVMNPETVSVDEDNAATGNVLANDSDVETTLQVTNFTVGGSTHAAGANVALAGVGSFSLGANGAYTFTPVANWTGTVPVVSYTTNTGASSTLAITVNTGDDATVVVADTATVNEDNLATGNVLANDSDVETALQVTDFTVGGSTYAAGTSVAIAGVGSFTLAANGAYSFTPVANWNGTVPVVSYTTNTGASSTLTLTVAPVDDATVVTADTAIVNEDNPATGNVLANDSDVETALQVANFTVAGNTYAAGTSVAIAGVGSFTLAANGAYSFTPAADWNGTVPVVSYTTSTGVGSTLAITVNPADDATVVVADTATVNEDSPATGNVLANDSDIDSPLQVTSFTIGGTSYAAGTSVAIAGVGSFSLAANGAYTFTPVADWNGAVPVVSYTTSTGAGSTLAITVHPVDDATIVVADTATVNEDNPAAGNVLANDSDFDSPLQVTSFTIGSTSYAAGSTVAIAGVGSFTLAADGSYTFTPAANWNGALPQVAYTTSTGAASTLDITVAPVDDATQVTADRVTVDEDNPATGNVLANDADVETPLQVASFTVGGSTQAAGTTMLIAGAGSFSVAADGSYVFTPAAHWNGAVPQVIYTTNTGATGTLDITVAPVDDASVVNADAGTAAEDTVARGNVLANDSDLDTPLQVASFTLGGTSYAAGSTVVVAGAGSFTLAANGDYAFTPAANWNGTLPQVGYTTSTGASSTLVLTVTPVDDATIATPDVRAGTEDTVASGNVLANDTDVDSTLQVASFSIAGTSYAAGATVAIADVGSFSLAASGDYVFTPAADWNGAVPTVTYVTSTGAASTLAIVLAPVDDAALLNPDSLTITEDSVAGGNVLANDSDIDSSPQVAGFTLGGTTYAAGSTVAIANVGRFTLLANGDYSFTPVENWNGALPPVTYTTSDGAGSTLALLVMPVDDASALLPDAVAVAEDSVASGNVLANDSDVDSTLRVASFNIGGTSYAAGSTVAIAGVGSFSLAANGSYSFTPVANWNGTLPPVSYTTSTGAVSTLAITVNPVDDATVAAADAATGNEDTTVSGNVLANDSDIDSTLQVASFAIGGATYAAGSTVVVAGAGSFALAANGAYTFTPAANWNGTLPPIGYTTSTGAGSTLAITVLPMDDATSAVADAATGGEDAVLTGNVLANDSDADGPLTVTGFSIGGASYAAGQTVLVAGAGIFTLAADGSFRFTPLADWNGGVPQVRYTLDTGASSTLDLVVAAVDDAPVRTSPPPADVVVLEGSDASSLGLAGIAHSAGGGSDEAARVLVYTVTQVPGGIGQVVLADGSTPVVVGGSYTLDEIRGMRFVPGATVQSGSGSFGFSVSDGSGTLQESITITVANQAPVLTGANVLPALLEDSTDAGMSIADLIAGHASDPLRRYGIAVVGAQSSGGQWQFTRDGGATWQSLAGASATNAELLAADALTRVRFVPAADWNGTAGGLSFRAWDRSTPAGVYRADTTLNGGSSAFSTGTASASLTVEAVNDAPAPLVATPTDLGGWDYSPGGGNDEATQSLTVVVTTLPPPTVGTLTLADGITPVSLGASYSLQDFRGVRFVAAPGADGQIAQFGWIVRDDGGTALGGVNETAGSVAIRVGAEVVDAPQPGADLLPSRGPDLLAGGGVASPEVPPVPAGAIPMPGRLAPNGLGDGAVAQLTAALFDSVEGFAPGFFQLVQDPGRSGDETAFQIRIGNLVFDLPGEFLVRGFQGLDSGGVRITLEQFQQAMRSGAFIDELNRLRRQLQEEFDLDRSTSITVAGLSLGVSVAYVLWLVRGGVLLGSYLSALPAWRLLDPLPVLARASDDDEEDEDGFDPDDTRRPDPLRGFA